MALVAHSSASGGWAGFSFPNKFTPVGDSRDQTDVNPATRPLIKFLGNTGSFYFADVDILLIFHAYVTFFWY